MPAQSLRRYIHVYIYIYIYIKRGKKEKKDYLRKASVDQDLTELLAQVTDGAEGDD
jgi:hypothetical protein